MGVFVHDPRLQRIERFLREHVMFPSETKLSMIFKHLKTDKIE
jgi:hypothetical protein